jgi:hypothetical protein
LVQNQTTQAILILTMESDIIFGRKYSRKYVKHTTSTGKIINEEDVMTTEK